MSFWHPTLHFRFAKRGEPVPGSAQILRVVRILQQGWEPSSGGPIDWRDVPEVDMTKSKETPETFPHPEPNAKETAESMHVGLVEKLAREAGMQTTGMLGHAPVFFTAGWHGVSKGQLEAFATLVARECAEICEATWEADEGGGEESSGFAVYGENSARAIRERFGIKE